MVAGLLALVATVSILPGATASAAAPEKLLIASITVTRDYARSHETFGVANRLGCRKNCAVLLRSADGGHSWTRMPAEGWSGQQVFSARIGRDRALLAAGPGGVEVSTNGGRDFDTVEAPSGTLDVAQADTRSAHVLIASDASQYLLRMPSRKLTKLPGTQMRQVTLRFNPSYPDVPAGQPLALAAGRDPSSDFPSVERCDAEFRCVERAVVQATPDGAKPAVSPSFDRDGTIYVMSSKAFFRSGDGGRTFQPAIVIPPAADTLVTTVQEVAFAPDFDPTRGRGRAYAAVVTVRGDAGGKGRVSGGVYASHDGAGDWRRIGRKGDPLATGASTVAVAPDGRLYAGALPFAGAGGQLVCASDGRVWRASCPAYPKAGSVTGSGVARAEPPAGSTRRSPRRVTAPEGIPAPAASPTPERTPAVPVGIAVGAALVAALAARARRARRARRAGSAPLSSVDPSLPSSSQADASEPPGAGRRAPRAGSRRR